MRSSKEPSSPMKNTEKNKTRGIVPIPRIPISKMGLQQKPSQQSTQIPKFEEVKKCDTVINQKRQLCMIENYTTGGVNSFSQILLECSF